MATYRRVLSTYFGIIGILLATVVQSAVVNPGRNIPDAINVNQNLINANAGLNLQEKQKIVGLPVANKNQAPFEDAQKVLAQGVVDANNQLREQNVLGQQIDDANHLKMVANIEAQQRQLQQQAKAPGIIGAMKAFKITESPACMDDVKKYCKGASATNNFAVLDCLQNDLEVSLFELDHLCFQYLIN